MKYMTGKSTFALAGSALVLLVWGIAPHSFMEQAAKLGQGFMGLHEAEEVVHYYSLTNLTGGLISIVIGVFIFFFIIRTLLCKKEDGYRVYQNMWPAWLDLEEICYRPLILTILPMICGFIFRIFDTLPDMIVVFLRKSVLVDSRIPREREEGDLVSAWIGHTRNGIQRIANKTWRRKNPTHEDYLHIEALKSQERDENFRIIQRSLSFGLMLFGVGLMLVLIYIVFL